jgi:hypothetical protein
MKKVQAVSFHFWLQQLKGTKGMPIAVYISCTAAVDVHTPHCGAVQFTKRFMFHGKINLSFNRLSCKDSFHSILCQELIRVARAPGKPSEVRAKASLCA